MCCNKVGEKKNTNQNQVPLAIHELYFDAVLCFVSHLQKKLKGTKKR